MSMPVSEKAWRLSQSGYSSMFIMINDQVSVEDLLQGIIASEMTHVLLWLRHCRHRRKFR